MGYKVCSESTYKALLNEYSNYVDMNLNIDIRRGRPATEQLNLSGAMLKVKSSDFIAKGTNADIRNYGLPKGLPEARQLFADLLGYSVDNVMIGGNSSLNLMYDIVANSMLRGVLGGDRWLDSAKIKFLCPAPGYDRHFKICQDLGIEMITVKMNADGPDMDTIEELVSTDPDIKGMWCVPQYSNPTGITFSDEVVTRMANLKPCCNNFRIFWDNSYCIHHLYPNDQDHVMDIVAACKEAGNPHMVYTFMSTSKVTFAGSGVAVVAASPENIDFLAKQFDTETIGFDKINQKMHVDFLKDPENILKHMERHAKIMRPKFNVVLKALKSGIRSAKVASWSNPKGGYFISVDVMPGCAAKVVDMAAKAGVFFTNAGSTFPYGKDPLDSNIRIAPTAVSVKDLALAMKVFCVCANIAAYEKCAK
ncbi:MAG: aminotransferase class I/II-fold pyridoxal phosphate-dependent enzyme [Clostridia bacterium]|nr:aminotransferase class I/II-fold pyridoxal phosphate-dependent enzyme [Clostridia bacterium]